MDGMVFPIKSKKVQFSHEDWFPIDLSSANRTISASRRLLPYTPQIFFSKLKLFRAHNQTIRR